jgi:hypothetical protein
VGGRIVTNCVSAWCVIATCVCFRVVILREVGVSELGQQAPHRGINQESLTRLYAERGEDESLGKTQRRQLILRKTCLVADLLNTGQ